MGIRIFLISLLASLPFFWEMNAFQRNLGNFFYWLELTNNPELSAAQERQLSFLSQIRELKPLRDKDIPNLDISAKSAVSVFIDNQRKERILFEKEGGNRLLIASLTKLMSAKVILENHSPNQIIKISKKAAGLPGNGAQKIKEEETFRAIDLLYPALMESNNTAVYALAESTGQEKFVELMNEKAKNLGMENTRFLNPTGLDEIGQYSTALDLVKLAKNLIEENSFIWKILSLREIKLYSSKGEFVYTVISTNELLDKIPSIIGGKTGETPQAGGCLLLIIEAPKSRGYLINIILNSEERFKEMEKLIDWDKNAYNW